MLFNSRRHNETRSKGQIMRVIVGLGNPEDTYKGTRHNIGFETINKLSYDYHIPVKKLRHRAYIGEGILAGEPVMLVKPQTYMNRSGESVRAVLQYYKLPPSALLVLYDDISLPVGDVRVREKGSAGGHNGMKSLLEQLQTDAFIRIRIGIGEKPAGWDLADYVLSRFKKEEWSDMIDGVTKAGDAVALILNEGTARAMDTYNKRVKHKATEAANANEPANKQANANEPANKQANANEPANKQANANEPDHQQDITQDTNREADA